MGRRRGRDTPPLPEVQLVFLAVKGNPHIGRALRVLALECERGTVLSLEAEYQRGHDFVAKLRCLGLVDVERLGLPGDVQVYRDKLETDASEDAAPDISDEDEEDTAVHRVPLPQKGPGPGGERETT